ncbi:tetratricopeptide repeat protein, partial [Fluviicola sp.]|uniref:tetratricopeptide repeat protein n=1 Tax=Fluviicola sp. TaxID=1917219 RepID=UPI00262B967D
HGTILFGGIILVLFMALNFYIPVGRTETLHLKVIKTARFGSRRGVGDPYAIVDYHGLKKQLVFPANTTIANNDYLEISLTKGLFGFPVVGEMQVINQREAEEERAYQKMLDRAEAYYSKGNPTKAIELYERASGLRPSDTLPKMRLKEIKKSLQQSSD